MPCSTGRYCRYGSWMSPVHPCRKGCKHPEGDDTPIDATELLSSILNDEIMEANKQQNFVMPKWMEPYRELLANTGGNTVENLLNDKSSNAFNNSIRVALITAVDAQVSLLMRLKKKGLLIKPSTGEAKGDLFQIAFDALRDIDLYSDVANPAATAKQLGDIATNALGNMYEIEQKQYDWTKHGDFCKYYDTEQKRNYWVLGYYGGGSIPLAESFYLARKMAEALSVPIESIKMSEVLHSRRFKGFKYMFSDTADQKPEEDIEEINYSSNVWQWLTD